MTINIYNTYTGKKEPFETIEEGLVRIYVCGATVYDRAHVGHAMSSLVFDVIRRYLIHKGYRVRYAQNFTDVDDKIIHRANTEGVSAYEIADRYVREFLVEQDRLGILPADIYPRVSSEMPSIISTIAKLIETGNAYPASNGDVYYSVRSFPSYLTLSRRTLDDAAQQEAASGQKRSVQDFALWKAAKPGEPYWDSPWGAGRPGWHIECSAMSQRHLGDQIDIHGGGNDLIFPHHENEIAQSESATGKSPFSRYWVHNGMLRLGDEKMSKSLGNIVPISQFLSDHEAEAFRLFVLSSHYRNPVTLSDESIAAAERGLTRLRGAMRPARGGDVTANADSRLAEAVERADSQFHDSMNDDFGTPGALAALFELVTAINTAREAGVSGNPFESAQSTLRDLAAVLGFRLKEHPGRIGHNGMAEPFIELLIRVRERARAKNDWELADLIRGDLASEGVALGDFGSGTSWSMTPAQEG